METCTHTQRHTHLLILVLVKKDVVKVLKQSRETGSFGEVRDAMVVEDWVTAEEAAFTRVL